MHELLFSSYARVMHESWRITYSRGRASIPGCSLHCEHFFENTVTPSFRYGIFGMLIFDVLSMNIIL